MYSEELIRIGSRKLKKYQINTSRLDSEILLSNLTGKSREFLAINPTFKIKNSYIKDFKKLIAKRGLSKEPIAYIIQKKDFWNSKLYIDKNALIPRPETEILIEKLSLIFKNKKSFILDVGTGSGCIITSLFEELKYSKGVAIDISSKALKVAKKNAFTNKTIDRIKFINVSIDKLYHYKFDLIVSNPPYIARHQLKNLSADIKFFEPKIALDGGNDGLDVIKKVIYKSRSILKVNGMLALEIGFGQYKSVSQILKFFKFREKCLIKDYQKNIRCILSVMNNN